MEKYLSLLLTCVYTKQKAHEVRDSIQELGKLWETFKQDLLIKKLRIHEAEMVDEIYHDPVEVVKYDAFDQYAARECQKYLDLIPFLFIELFHITEESLEIREHLNLTKSVARDLKAQLGIGTLNDILEKYGTLILQKSNQNSILTDMLKPFQY